jgi:hypothetical protein
MPCVGDRRRLTTPASSDNSATADAAKSWGIGGVGSTRPGCGERRGNTLVLPRPLPERGPQADLDNGPARKSWPKRDSNPLTLRMRGRRSGRPRAKSDDRLARDARARRGRPVAEQGAHRDQAWVPRSARRLGRRRHRALGPDQRPGSGLDADRSQLGGGSAGSGGRRPPYGAEDRHPPPVFGSPPRRHRAVTRSGAARL